jgi:hypothetical protein
MCGCVRSTTLWPQTCGLARPRVYESTVGIHLLYYEFAIFANDEIVNVKGVLYF